MDAHRGAAQDGRGLDTLLEAADTLPHAEADAWQLDLLRVALRIARSTEAAVDLQRADLAFRALPERLRVPLAERAARIARREAERAARQPPPERQTGWLAALRRRKPTGTAAPTSGTTAKERLLRELSQGRMTDS